MKRIRNFLLAGMLVIMSVLSAPVNAEAATTYRDDWYTYRVTGATASDDVVKIKKNTETGKYIGVCSYSDSSYDSVAISGYVPSASGSTMLTTITTSVSKYRQAGDVQTFSATTSNDYARFSLKIECTSGVATNKGYVYWVSNS